MFTDVQIVNLGLGKIASARISRMDPPSSSLERHCAGGYTMWKRTELAKRRWVFALEIDYALTQVAELSGTDKPYKYSLPPECLRPVREKYTEWRQAGRFLYSAEKGLKITFVKDVDESEFDPLFVDVLACRIAQECTEYVTQSNTKIANADALYKASVAVAAQANGFVIGPEDIQADDNDFSWVNSRY